jgi:Flp pilus assembly protein TadG
MFNPFGYVLSHTEWCNTMRCVLTGKKGVFLAFKRRKGRTLPALRAFVSNHSGSALIESVLVMPAFFGFLFLLIDTAIIFLSSSQLDGGLEAAKRMVATGEINKVAHNLRESTFRTAFCTNVATIVNCADVKFDIRAFQNFAAVQMADPIYKGKLNTAAFSTNFGTACDIVVIRAYYELTSVSGMLRSDVQRLTPLTSFITSSVAFRNEEYASC